MKLIIEKQRQRIAEIRKAMADFPSLHQSGCLAQIADCEEIITALESMPVWVKCVDRVPNDETIVPVVTDRGYRTYASPQDVTSREWWDEVNKRFLPGVVMWYDVPAPPIQQEG